MIEQTLVHFDSGGIACVGYLYRSTGTGAPRPCVVLATGFIGTQDTPSIRATARAFAAAGLAALTFDYRNFGESEGAPRQVIGIKQQHDDIRAAVRFSRSRAGIDPERVALWGTSLGGGHVIAVAADDPRIAAVVAQVPFNGFPEKVEGRSVTATGRLLLAALEDALRGWLGRPPRYIPAVGTTGELAVMATPEARQAIEGMQSNHWKNEVAPRVLLEMMRYKPGEKAHRLAMPVLVSAAADDRETPVELAREIAENAPRGEFKTYSVTHFDLYRPEVRRRVIADQIVFLQKHLGVEPRGIGRPRGSRSLV
jgi:dienelactone hydrolase